GDVLIMFKMKVLKLILVAGVIFGVFFGVGTGLTHLLTSPTGILAEDDEQDGDQQATVEEGERTSVLILGVDARPGDDHPRSDTMLLATIDPELKKVAIVSIPRDTKVKLKNGQIDKITAANSLGGPNYAVAAVEKLMDTDIDYYVEMDFNGFKDIVDALGGVNINVPQRMKKLSEGINLYSGQQKLNGTQALAYVRFRDYPMGDIQRTAAQQEFLKALTAEVLKPGTITKLPKLAKTIDKCTDSNLRLGDMLKMASWAPGFTKESLVTQTLPGSFYDERDSYGNLLVSYWLADTKKIPTLVDNMLAGKTVAVVQGTQSSQAIPASGGKLSTPEPVNEEETVLEGSGEAKAPNQDTGNNQQPVEPLKQQTGNKTNAGAGQPVNTEPPKNPAPDTVKQDPVTETTPPVNTPAVTDPTGPAGYI
ncbi:MAG: LCP family protein, partial [Syntrophomonas sp.]